VRDAEKTEKMYSLNKDFGSVTIISKDARIFIDGKSAGKNRIEKNMKPGKYKIKAIKDNHRDDEKEIFVNIGRSQEVTLKPEPMLGSLSVFSEPTGKTKGAEILIDGESTGKKTNAVLPLLIGDHSITLKLDGYLNKTENFSLSEGENKKLTLLMQTYQGSQKSKRDFWNTQKWVALGSFTASAAVSGFCHYQAESYYTDYQDATTSKDATDFYDKTESFDNYRNISGGVSLVPLGYFFYAWYMESRY